MSHRVSRPTVVCYSTRPKWEVAGYSRWRRLTAVRARVLRARTEISGRRPGARLQSETGPCAGGIDHDQLFQVFRRMTMSSMRILIVVSAAALAAAGCASTKLEEKPAPVVEQSKPTPPPAPAPAPAPVAKVEAPVQ